MRRIHVSLIAGVDEGVNVSLYVRVNRGFGRRLVSGNNKP